MKTLKQRIKTLTGFQHEAIINEVKEWLQEHLEGKNREDCAFCSSIEILIEELEQ